MKRILILTISFLFAVTAMKAQFTVSVSGTVTNQTGNAVSNVPITIIDSLSGVVSFAQTDNNGFYIDSLFPAGGTQGMVLVTTQDCNGSLFQAGFYSQANPNVIANFTNFCDSTSGGGGGGSCAATFTHFDSVGTHFFFSSVTGTAPFTYFWDFGDGNTSTQANPIHTYNSPAGAYTVTLGITDATGCANFYTSIVYINGGGGGGNGCYAFFLPLQQSGLTFDFLSLSSAASPFTTSWSFDGGITYTMTGDSISYTFSQTGFYDICVQVSDTIGCVSTFCQPMFIDTTSTGGGGQGQCFTDYTFTTSNLTASFTSNPPMGTAPFIYHWDFGDGNTSTLANPVHTYAQGGTYIAALTVTDAAGCVSYYCLFVTVGTAPSCYVSLGVNSTNNLTVDLTAYASGLAPYSYYWSVDGGLTYTAGTANFNHTFASSGFYDVCVMAETADSCVATDCFQVWVGNNTANINVLGFVFTGQNPAGDNEALAYLISYDSIAQTLTAVDSMNVVGGIFYFSNVPAGDYLVKAAMLPASPDYANYLPTYLGDVLLWSQSTPINITPNNMNFPMFINMTAGANPGGPGFIGGSVLQGANFTGAGTVEDEGDPVPNAPVLLLDANGNAVAHTVTDANGLFSFSGIAYGTYQVHVDLLNVRAVPYWVTIDAANPSVGTTNFTYSTIDGIEPATSTTNLSQVEDIRLYPNPVDNALSVELNLKESIEASLVIYDLLGQEVQAQAKSLQAGQQFISLDVERLPAGTYILNLISDGKFVSQKFVKQ